MKKVDVVEVDAYSWYCPECETHNINDKYARLICDNCYEEFEVENTD